MQISLQIEHLTRLVSECLLVDAGPLKIKYNMSSRHKKLVYVSDEEYDHKKVSQNRGCESARVGDTFPELMGIGSRVSADVIVFRGHKQIDKSFD